VTGGTGTLGVHAVTMLRERGHDVRVLSRRTGGDLMTGAGIREAVEGVELVLHAASDPHRRFGAGDPQQTRNLLAACGDVRHLLYVSIVGIDRMPYGYYRHKLACERLVRDSRVPYSIQRATQFHELLDDLLTRAARWPLVPLPLRAKVQPVASAEVATRCVDVLGAGPQGRVPDFGGPEILTLREVLEAWPGRVRALPLPAVGRVLRGFGEGRNTTPEHAQGRLTWAEYLANR
jgi:uncharacterized protein YbjT (DUF2867 family)